MLTWLLAPAALCHPASRAYGGC